MQKRTRCTIQEIIDDLRMTSTTTSQPIKPKSLTLLELCQTINDLRHTSSRSTAQILTRRLYLHPLTINTNAKQQSTKIINNNLLHIEQHNQANLEKRNSPRPHKPYRGLAILSSSLPLITRTNAKLHSSITTDNSSDFEASTTTISSNRVSLPSINRGISSSSSSKRSVPIRSSYIPSQQKNIVNHNNRWEKVDVWLHLARTLQKPAPKDPPTTPLDALFDFEVENIQEPEEQQRQQQQSNYDSIQEIKIYKRNPVCVEVIKENDNNDED
ncbi:unnamed protein product [Rotaria sordida]|uniref:Uncharacterized protein n=2 Tax=Rotaria sordida TaxID=392033 RepID=A0A815E2G6_9BILA|nr:unnamed protein product [Rotaria sordida]CAF1100559.1 unnamed protein product [Rotaria sordida]CAF1305588.1 unnamed protein product [Rotaria sordida]